MGEQSPTNPTGITQADLDRLSKEIESCNIKIAELKGTIDSLKNIFNGCVCCPDDHFQHGRV